MHYAMLMPEFGRISLSILELKAFIFYYSKVLHINNDDAGETKPTPDLRAHRCRFVLQYQHQTLQHFKVVFAARRSDSF